MIIKRKNIDNKDQNHLDQLLTSIENESDLSLKEQLLKEQLMKTPPSLSDLAYLEGNKQIKSCASLLYICHKSRSHMEFDQAQEQAKNEGLLKKIGLGAYLLLGEAALFLIIIGAFLALLYQGFN